MSKRSGNFSYYDVLGISEHATAEEIKTAYRAAAAKYHPDVNKAPNASRLMEMLNEAYATLSDPRARATYDAQVETGKDAESPGSPDADTYELLGCDRCGSISADLRFAVFWRTWAIILYTRMLPTGGVFCRPCRSTLAWQAALFTALLGWWGFIWPWLYSIRSMFAAVRGGEKPRLQNAQLLRHQGIAFALRGQYSEAKRCMLDAQGFEAVKPVEEMLSELQGEPAPKLGATRGQLAAAGIWILAVFLVFVWFTSSGNTEGHSRAATQPAETDANRSANDSPQFSASEQKRLQGLMVSCASSPKADTAAAAISACDEILTQLHKLASRETGSIARQQYELFEDLTQWHKALHADALGNPTQARRLMDDVVSDLKALSSSGVSPKIRRDADRYYSCFATDQCPEK